MATEAVSDLFMPAIPAAVAIAIMDSWPLDQNGIVQVLNSQNWDDLEWSGNFDEEDEAIGAAQSVRGYHTLEYLLFKDGQPRTVDGAK